MPTFIFPPVALKIILPFVFVVSELIFIEPFVARIDKLLFSLEIILLSIACITEVPARFIPFLAITLFLCTFSLRLYLLSSAIRF